MLAWYVSVTVTISPQTTEKGDVLVGVIGGNGKVEEATGIFIMSIVYVVVKGWPLRLRINR